MNQALIVALAQVAYWAVCKGVNKSLSGMTFLILLQATAQHCLVEIDFGPVSVRSYNAVVLFITALATSPPLFSRLRAVPHLRAMFLTWCCYLIWALATAPFNGNLAQGESFLVNFLSKHATATMVFYAMAVGIRSLADAKVVIVWLGILSAANASFAGLQARGVGFAWQFHEQLFPISRSIRLELIAETGAEAVRGYAPGLSSYSIMTGYVMLCFGFFWPVAAGRLGAERRYVAALLAAAIWALICFGTVSSISRSSLYIALGLTLPAALLGAISSKASLSSVLLPTVLTLIVGTMLFVTRTMAVSVSETRDTQLDRLFVFEDHSRVELARDALRQIQQAPLLGGHLDALSSGAVGTTPHNFILNAALYNGLPGALMVLAMTVLQLMMLFKLTRIAIRSQHASVWILAVVFGLFAYLLKGCVHNDSFVVGGLMGWYLIGTLPTVTLIANPSQVPPRTTEQYRP